jgi:5-(carboxyamino)imidazole ribonucleotide synthase
MTVLGVVGGGQLARMLGLAAAPLGVGVRVLARTTDEGVRGLLPVVDGDPDDLEALRRLAAEVDVVTFDHELVPLDAVRALEAEGVVVRPSSSALAFADKLRQRRAFAAADLPVPPFAEVLDEADVAAFAGAHGWPVVLKAPWGGYDGRGVAVAVDAGEAADMLAAAGGRPLLAERHLPLVQELAVVVVTDVEGVRASYAPVVSVQAGDGADVVLELARGAAVDGVVPRVVDARGDLVDQQAPALELEHLDPDHPHVLEPLQERGDDR